MARTARVERIDPYRWRVPKQGGMRTHGLIFADEELIKDLEGDQAVQRQPVAEGQSGMHRRDINRCGPAGRAQGASAWLRRRARRGGGGR